MFGKPINRKVREDDAEGRKEFRRMEQYQDEDVRRTGFILSSGSPILEEPEQLVFHRFFKSLYRSAVS